ncbi:MAG: hypothetical protein WCJ54_07635 [Actinomycetota bacterium]
MINANFVLFGALLNLIGSSSYAIDTFRGKTKPNRVTWFLWALAPMIAFSAQISGGIGIRSLMTFMVGFGPAIVFIASFMNKKAYWKISKLDIACGVLSVLALILWYLTKNAAVAILLSILADALAGVPTIIKAYKEPETESYNVFFFGAISAAITLLTIEIWTFEVAAFPVYIFAICSLLFVLIFRKQGIQLVKK